MVRAEKAANRNLEELILLVQRSTCPGIVRNYMFISRFDELFSPTV